MLAEEQLDFFALNGYLIVKSFEASVACVQMSNELQKAVDEDNEAYSNVFDVGMVHNCFMRGEMMLEHLSSQRLRQYTDELLCRNAIIYAYQSSSLQPGGGNYGSRVHVDCPRFIPGYRTILGIF